MQQPTMQPQPKTAPVYYAQQLFETPFTFHLNEAYLQLIAETAEDAISLPDRYNTALHVNRYEPLEINFEAKHPRPRRLGSLPHPLPAASLENECLTVALLRTYNIYLTSVVWMLLSEHRMFYMKPLSYVFASFYHWGSYAVGLHSRLDEDHFLYTKREPITLPFNSAFLIPHFDYVVPRHEALNVERGWRVTCLDGEYVCAVRQPYCALDEILWEEESNSERAEEKDAVVVDD